MVHTFNLMSVGLDNVPNRWVVGITSGDCITASVPVIVVAAPCAAVYPMSVENRDISTWACVGGTFVLFGTAPIDINISAVHVVAEDVCGIRTQRITLWT
jgi:hypothetical protein